ncbi:MAG: hypothetical protein II840_01170 [Kiritimatiellae bacterium]|nr:hypothetical protein [Kiritimatiellia bacterium]
MSARGSMLLEYAMTLFVGIVFVAAGLSVFEPGNGYTALGERFTQYFQRLLVGISMPVP